jgi:hypothetical protein
MHGETVRFLKRVLKNTQISNLMKIRPVVAELFHADGRTDTTKLIFALRDFANAPRKNVLRQYNGVNYVTTAFCNLIFHSTSTRSC